MNAELFGRDSPGRLVKISSPFEDVAFVPDPLPRNYELPRGLFRLLVEAKEELARLDGGGRHLENPNLLLTPLKRREALKSSSIEGTVTSAEQLLLYEAAGAKEDRRGSDVEEVGNYSAALDLGVETLEQIPFSLRLMKVVHRRLMRGVRGERKTPGEFRRSQVHIGKDRRFIPPPPGAELDACLDQFESDMHADVGVDPLVWCYMLHYQVETIHPFSDGNGRLGRLLLGLTIADRCRLSRPWLYMSPWFEQYKSQYIDLLFGVSATGDWDSWLEFCLQGTLEQALDTSKRLNELIDLRRDYRQRVSASNGSTRLHTILDSLFDAFPLVRISSLRETLGVTYPTVKSDIGRLRELGILEELPDSRPKAFYAPDIVRIGIGA